MECRNRIHTKKLWNFTVESNTRIFGIKRHPGGTFKLQESSPLRRTSRLNFFFFVGDILPFWFWMNSPIHCQKICSEKNFEKKINLACSKVSVSESSWSSGELMNCRWLLINLNLDRLEIMCFFGGAGLELSCFKVTSSFRSYNNFSNSTFWP